LDKAIRRARGLAHQTAATIDLFNAIPSSVSTGTLHAESEQFTRLEAEQHRRLLERTANRLRREEIIVNTKVETGYPAHEAILREVEIPQAQRVRAPAAHSDRFRADPALPCSASDCQKKHGLAQASYPGGPGPVSCP
jgi:hypothetical protein